MPRVSVLSYIRDILFISRTENLFHKILRESIATKIHLILFFQNESIMNSSTGSNFFQSLKFIS